MLVIDGFKCQTHNVIAGLPQGSPVSPILFIIYISRMFQELESKFPRLKTISFSDNTTFLFTGTLIQEVVKTLEEIGAEVINWGQRNKVEFQPSKTEAVLFSRSRKAQRKARETTTTIRFGEEQISFQKEATKWLGF